eukprot:jgi/Bigna1/63838/fgenesh1_kg.61_\
MGSEASKKAKNQYGGELFQPSFQHNAKEVKRLLEKKAQVNARQPDNLKWLLPLINNFQNLPVILAILKGSAISAGTHIKMPGLRCISHADIVVETKKQLNCSLMQRLILTLGI